MTTEECTEHVLALIEQEIRQYSCKSESLLQDTKVVDLLKFRVSNCLEEFQTQLPVLSTVVTKSCSFNIQQRGNTKKNIESISQVVTSIIAKILSTHNQRLSALKYINGIILKDGGAKDTCLQRFASFGDSVTPVSVNRKLDEMAEHATVLVNKFDTPSTNSCIVFDNVNPYVKVRQETATNHNKLINLTHAIAVKDRVPVQQLSGPPKRALSEIAPVDIIPNPDDITRIKALYTIHVLRIWSTYIPSLAWMSPNEDSLSHKYKDYAACNSDVVS